MSEQGVTQVQFHFSMDGIEVTFCYADGRHEKALLSHHDMMALGIDMYRLDQYSKCGTGLYFRTIEGKVKS